MEFHYNFFSKYLINSNNKVYSRNSSFGAVFSERSNRNIRDLPKRPVFEKRDGNWIDVLPRITKQYINRIHSNTKLTPIQASVKKNEGFVYKKLIGETKKKKSKVSSNRSR